MGHEVDLFYKPWTLFWIIEFMGILLFVIGMAYKFSFYFKGQKKSLYNAPNYWVMVKTFFREVILQKQIVKKSVLRWCIHISIFYGFVGLMLLSAIAVILITVIPQGTAISQYLLFGQGHNYLKAAGDFFGLLMLMGVSAALLRRFVFREKELDTDINDTTTLAFLLILVVTGFVLEAIRISLIPLTPAMEYSFVGFRLAELFRGLDGVKSLASLVWIAHGVFTAALFAYFPYSKLLHVIFSPVEIVLNASEERMRGDLYL